MPEVRSAIADSFPIYIAYDRLLARDLGQIVSLLSKVGDSCAERYAKGSGLSWRELPVLEVDSIHTGDSIKLTFGEGWLPSISSSEDDDIIITVPKKLGIPLLIGYLILSGVSRGLEIRNDYLDGRIKELEIRLKEYEIANVLEKAAPGEVASEAVGELIPFLERMDDFTQFALYDIDLLRFVRAETNERSHPTEDGSAE